MLTDGEGDDKRYKKGRTIAESTLEEKGGYMRIRNLCTARAIRCVPLDRGCVLELHIRSSPPSPPYIFSGTCTLPCQDDLLSDIDFCSAHAVLESQNEANAKTRHWRSAG